MSNASQFGQRLYESVLLHFNFYRLKVWRIFLKNGLTRFHFSCNFRCKYIFVLMHVYICVNFNLYLCKCKYKVVRKSINWLVYVNLATLLRLPCSGRSKPVEGLDRCLSSQLIQIPFRDWTLCFAFQCFKRLLQHFKFVNSWFRGVFLCFQVVKVEIELTARRL